MEKGGNFEESSTSNNSEKDVGCLITKFPLIAENIRENQTNFTFDIKLTALILLQRTTESRWRKVEKRDLRDIK